MNTVPEPDIAWVERLNYSKTRPTVANVFLIVEVSHSSLAYDRGEKAALYAEVGISDYWIVNIRDRCVEVHRLPYLAAFGDIRIYGEGESITPLHFPSISLPVKTLFGA